MKGDRGREVRRQHLLLRFIHYNRFATIAQLAKEFHVTEKSIRRDINVLVRAGYPIIKFRGDEDTRIRLRLQSGWCFCRNGPDENHSQI